MVKEPDQINPKLTRFIQLFNEAKFFEAHEELEQAWREEKGPDRDFYQGLIQIAAALVHVQRKNPQGAQRLFQTASNYLQPYLPQYRCILLEQLLSQTQACLVAAGDFPRI